MIYKSSGILQLLVIQTVTSLFFSVGLKSFKLIPTGIYSKMLRIDIVQQWGG